MQTLLSGLSEQASYVCVGAPLDGAFSIDWQPAPLFIVEAAMATDESVRQWVWLYRAPWTWLAEGNNVDAVAALQEWLSQQRAVLQLRRHLRQRLILVNVDRVAAQPLATHLGFQYTGAKVEHQAVKPLTAALGSLFEDIASEFWTLYEALEAVAWIPEGEAEFRSNRILPTREGLNELLELIHTGAQLPTARKKIDEYEQSIHNLHQELSKAQAAEQYQKEESESLLLQLQHLQEEVEKLYLSEGSLKNEYATLNKELVQTIADRQKISNALTTAEQTCVELLEKEITLTAIVSEKSKIEESIAAENDVLLAQLYKVQGDLEKSCLANMSAKQQHAELQKDLNKSATQKIQLTNSLNAAHVALANAEQMRLKFMEREVSLQKNNTDMVISSQVLTEENDVLLTQLHQVQEELEHYYLANREMVSAIAQSEHTLNRARSVISRMADHA